eukprot:scaffold7341_cov229-Pinguiococcus_pyrenoidosus.AAC.11
MPAAKLSQSCLDGLFQIFGFGSSGPPPGGQATDLHELVVVNAAVIVGVEGIHKIVDLSAAKLHIQLAQSPAKFLPRDATWKAAVVLVT